MSGINDPDRVKFINDRLVNRPMASAEIGHWQDLFMTWQDMLDAGEMTDEGRAHWVHQARLHLWDGTIPADQLAYIVRTRYIMDLWDQEHRGPADVEALIRKAREGPRPPWVRGVGEQG
jgi:hypothetical protein